MQKSSIFGAIFLGLFGLPFLGFGVVFMVKMMQVAATGTNPNAYLGVAFGLVFACIGLGLEALAVASVRYSKKQAAVVAANPGAPWMWRDDWAAGRADGKRAAANVTFWVFAGFWDLISFPAAAAAIPKITAGQTQLLFVMIFPIIGIGLTSFAALSTMRSRRFGQTSFWLATNPFTPGGKVSGSIHLRMPVAADHGIDLRLSCVRQITTGSGNSRSTTETVLWQDERNIPGSAIARMDVNAQIPVEFQIPTNVYLTNTDNPSDKILWKLHAKADVPGVDFKDDYELPVFRTSTSPATPETETWVDDGAHNRDMSAPERPAWSTTSASAPPTDEPVVAPDRTHIVITEDGASTQVYFPPLRNPGQTFAFFAFTAVWTGVVYLIFTHSAPWLFRIVFGGADVLLGLILFNLVFGSSLIRVGEGTLSIRKAFLGIGSTKAIPLDGVKSVAPVSQGQADASGSARFGIFIQLTDGRLFKVANATLSRTEARWIVAAIDRVMGRKEDTQPQFQPVTMLLPAQSKPGVVRIGGVSTAKLGRVVGALFFVGWLFFVGRFVFHFTAISSKPATHEADVAQPNPVPVAVSMSDEDVSRVLNLRPQQQVEELLDRSIRRDERALQVLLEHASEWTSNIHETDRLKRLEEQARFSGDLRVRQADEDIELALDGWQKNADAVDRLIGRARSDPQYKAAALYFLGMEGGRGVETQHVYDTLREYALHDPDATSRQWAVEGLRFLQTDDALETLWQSFTSDSSFAVRNRAGCNLADCGMFSREQRMRSVPKLLALLDDPNLNPQMRSWCFMALREITGANLPDDPVAWNHWYSDRGREVLSNFHRLPWYQLQGDN